MVPQLCPGTCLLSGSRTCQLDISIDHHSQFASFGSSSIKVSSNSGCPPLTAVLRVGRRPPHPAYPQSSLENEPISVGVGEIPDVSDILMDGIAFEDSWDVSDSCTRTLSQVR